MCGYAKTETNTSGTKAGSYQGGGPEGEDLWVHQEGGCPEAGANPDGTQAPASGLSSSAMTPSETFLLFAKMC